MSSGGKTRVSRRRDQKVNKKKKTVNRPNEEEDGPRGVREEGRIMLEG